MSPFYPQIEPRDGNPRGQYPMDSDYPEEYETFAELREAMDDAADSLNIPISYYFSEAEPEWDEEAKFQLVFLMPRKSRTWSVETRNFDRAEVEEWLAEWLPPHIFRWWGWDYDRVKENA